jgi:serine protease inhibitor
VDELIRLILTSAMYFYDAWKYQLVPEYARDMDFHLLEGSVAQVPMMQSEGINGDMTRGT